MEEIVSRGIRNSNPGNIRQSSTRFKGEVRPSQDSAFKQFSSMVWGYRAIFVILNTYATKHRLRTIREMISRWAPPVENHTNIYIDTVSQLASLDADTPIDTLQREVMLPLVAAMSQVENGTKADYTSLERGFDLYIVDIEERNAL